MVLRAHFTVPVNFRSRDRPIMEAALEIAEEEHVTITALFRNAMSDYVLKKKRDSVDAKLEHFLEPRIPSCETLDKVLTPEILKGWSDQDLLSMTRKVRARTEELEAELKKRGYFMIKHSSRPGLSGRNDSTERVVVHDPKDQRFRDSA